jgi:uncharacterized protein YndB with AHSA1/START domain
MDRGTYTQVDGRPAVRFERVYPHPIQRVWTAVSTPERLAGWFPFAVEIEPRVGGRMRFSGNPHAEAMAGEVLVYDPPRALEFIWGTSELRFELSEAGPDATRFVLYDLLGAENEAARNAAGWESCLVGLAAVVSEGADAPEGAKGEDWQSRYDAYVASGMPAGADIPS